MKIKDPTVCTKQDLPAVITLIDSVLRTDSDQSMLTDYPLVFRDENLRNIRIIKADEQTVAVVPYIPRTIIGGTECQFTAGIISPTATHPDYRRTGYGLACLNSCLQQMKQDKIDLSILWTRVPTFPFFEKAGYQAVRTQVTKYMCYRQDVHRFQNHGHQIVAYEPAEQQYLAEIQPLHEAEYFGVLRHPQDYIYLFSLPKMKTLFALQEGRVSAYLIVSQAVNKPGLLEGGGTATGLQTLLHHTLNQWPDDDPIPAYAYLSPSVLGDLLEQTIPERREPWGNNMMIRMNSVPRFFEKIAPWLDQKSKNKQIAPFSLEVTDTQEFISFDFTERGLRLGNNKRSRHIALTRQTLTSLLFGEHLARRVVAPNDIFCDLFPLYFPIWIMDSSS